MITQNEINRVFDDVFRKEEESHQRIMKRHEEIMSLIDGATKETPQSCNSKGSGNYENKNSTPSL